LLGNWRSHKQFQIWLEQKLLSFLPEHEQQIRFHPDIIEKVYALDLDKLLPLVQERYALTGRPAKNQPEIFRALVTMSHFKEGVTSFVSRLKAHPVLAAICGFEPDSIPGVGTFYDFLDRFWLGEEPPEILRELYRKRGKKPKSGKKLTEDPNRLSELLAKAFEGHCFEDRPESLLQKILTECAVKPSAKLGLLGLLSPAFGNRG